MGSILPFLPINSFDPEMTRAMSAAFDSAWEQLAAAGHAETMPFRADVTRERIASAIIREARKGVSDPQKLVIAGMTVILRERRERMARKIGQPEQPLAS
jgi:hypothetical protein